MSAAVEFSEQRIDAFPTRVFRRKYAGLEAYNQKLARIIVERKATSDGGLVRSNVGSWHSENDLLRWEEPEIKVLLNLMQSALMDYVGEEIDKDPESFELRMALEAWANVSEAGNYAKPHVHPMSNFAVVYYVDIGDYQLRGADDHSGCLEFIDPRNRVSMLATPGVDARDSLRMRPENGVLVIFPSWMYHYVHPYNGKRPRISIACNATVQDLKLKAPAPSKKGRPASVIIDAD